VGGITLLNARPTSIVTPIAIKSTPPELAQVLIRCWRRRRALSVLLVEATISLGGALSDAEMLLA
jgi:hypothetical protein